MKEGRKRTLVRIKFGDNFIVPEWEAIAHEPVGKRTYMGEIELYEENKSGEQQTWSIAPESMIQETDFLENMELQIPVVVGEVIEIDKLFTTGLGEGFKSARRRWYWPGCW